MAATTRRKQRAAKLGRKNPNYKTGKSTDSNGYVTIPAPRKGSGGKRQYEHIAKAKPKRGQVAHHKDRDRSNNRRSNLQPTRKHPGGKRIRRPV